MKDLATFRRFCMETLFAKNSNVVLP